MWCIKAFHPCTPPPTPVGASRRAGIAIVNQLCCVQADLEQGNTPHAESGEGSFNTQSASLKAESESSLPRWMGHGCLHPDSSGTTFPPKTR